MKRIAINGFGRIGRVLFRILQQESNFEVVVINDMAHPRVLSHLLKYDSIHGKFTKDVSYTNSEIIVNGSKITILNHDKLKDLFWRDFNIDVVFECTGSFKTRKENLMHINAGAKKVILCSPPIGVDIPMVVLGVNDNIITKEDKIISNASCTTNCAAPMIQVLHDTFKLERAYVTTIHSFTSDQNLHDGIHMDLRRGRSAPNSIIPTTTGAAKALSHIFSELELGGCGIRVPVSNCSLIDLTCIIKEKTSKEHINKIFKLSSQNKFKHIIDYNTDPIVSVDVTSNTYSCVFDAQLTSVLGNMVKVVGWYDNEYGYSSRLIDLLKQIS